MTFSVPLPVEISSMIAAIVECFCPLGNESLSHFLFVSLYFHVKCVISPIILLFACKMWSQFKIKVSYWLVCLGNGSVFHLPAGRTRCWETGMLPCQSVPCEDGVTPHNMKIKHFFVCLPLQKWAVSHTCLKRSPSLSAHVTWHVRFSPVVMEMRGLSEVINNASGRVQTSVKQQTDWPTDRFDS